MYFLRMTVITFAVIGFVTTAHCQSEIQNGQQHAYLRREIIAYDWKVYGIEVSFCRQDTNLNWTMAVRDSQGVMYQTLSANGQKVWDASDGKCSLPEYLQIIDLSLTDFHNERPSAKLGSIDIEMEIVKDSWVSIMDGLRKRLSELPGEKTKGRFEVPTEIEDTIQRTLEESSVTEATKKLLKRHGMDVQLVDQSEHIIFQDSLTGRKWSDIARLAGIGIMAPGTIEYIINGN